MPIDLDQNIVGPMIGQNILDRVNAIIDDSIDDDTFLFMVNNAKNNIEAGRDWYFNRSFDNSQIWSPGDTYLTTHPLPQDFLASRELFLLGDILPYIQITFEMRERFKDIYRRYYIDYKNQTFAICGSGPGARAIDHYYAAATPDITLATSPAWPTPFHPLLVWKVAEMWGSTMSADDIDLRQSQNQLRQYNELLKMFIAWDARLKTRDYNDKNSQNYDLKTQPNVVATEFLM